MAKQKLSEDRFEIPQPWPPEIQHALFTLGDFINSHHADDLSSHITIHRNGEGIDYEFTMREVGRRPSIVDGEIIKEVTCKVLD